MAVLECRCPYCRQGVRVPEGVTPELHEYRLILLGWLKIRGLSLLAHELDEPGFVRAAAHWQERLRR